MLLRPFAAILSLSVIAFALEDRVIAKCYIKPCEITGDFDGDGKADKAVLIQNAEGKRGIQFRLANGRRYVVGAGSPAGNGGDDFNWMDHWELHHGAMQQGADEMAPPKVNGDSVLLVKTESASGILYWNGSKFAWYQQGD